MAGSISCNFKAYYLYKDGKDIISMDTTAYPFDSGVEPFQSIRNYDNVVVPFPTSGYYKGSTFSTLLIKHLTTILE